MDKAIGGYFELNPNEKKPLGGNHSGQETGKIGQETLQAF